MTTITTAIKQFMADENGVTAIEYGLIAALIASVLAVGVGAVSGQLSLAFDYIKTKMVTPAI